MLNTKFTKMKDMTSTMVLVGMLCLSSPINASANINNSIKMNNEISKYDFNNHRNKSTIIKYESHKADFNVQKEANQIFGEMREATIEEELMVKNYINSISKYTGVNFWD